MSNRKGSHSLRSRYSFKSPGSRWPRRSIAVVFLPSSPIWDASQVTVCCAPEVHTSPCLGEVIAGSYTSKMFGCTDDGKLVVEGTAALGFTAAVGTAAADMERARAERRAPTRGVNMAAGCLGVGYVEGVCVL